MIKQVSIQNLGVGMYISGFKASWFKTPFLTHSFLITTKTQIEKLFSSGIKDVFIDTTKGRDLEKRNKINNKTKPASFLKKPSAIIVKKAPSDSKQDKNVMQDFLEFHNELGKAKKVKSKLQEVTLEVVKAIQSGHTMNTQQVMGVANMMTKSVYRNKFAMSSLIGIKNLNKHTFDHSINSAILAASFGSHLGLSSKDITVLGVGGLLHDVGKVRINEDIIEKPTSQYTKSEAVGFKRHVAYTLDILRRTQDMPQSVLQMAAQHHEMCDGSGYPLGIKKEKISTYARITAVIDMYDLLISKTKNRTPLLPNEAILTMHKLESKLDKKFVQEFTQYIGLYPIGSYVLLNSGVVAVVIRNNSEDLSFPIVRKVINKNGFRVNPKSFLNLAEEKHKGGIVKKIVKVINKSDYNLPAFTELEMPSFAKYQYNSNV